MVTNWPAVSARTSETLYNWIIYSIGDRVPLHMNHVIAKQLHIAHKTFTWFNMRWFCVSSTRGHRFICCFHLAVYNFVLIFFPSMLHQYWSKSPSIGYTVRHYCVRVIFLWVFVRISLWSCFSLLSEILCFHVFNGVRWPASVIWTGGVGTGFYAHGCTIARKNYPSKVNNLFHSMVRWCVSSDWRTLNDRLGFGARFTRIKLCKKKH